LLIGFYGVSLGLMNLFFYLSLERIPLGLAVTLEFIGPLSVSILFSRKFKDVLWVFFAACGIGLLFYQGEIKTDLLGMIFALIAGVFWGLYIVFGKKISHNEHQSLILSAFGMLFAAVIVLPVGLFMNASAIVNPQNWLAGLGVAVLSSAIPYALELRAMKFIPEKTFGILMSFEPVIATVVGLVFLKESLALNQVIAICLVIAACFGSAYELRPTKS
jgi:inner membrane transporter RhtA